MESKVNRQPNIEKFHKMLNSCQNPEAVYAALMALAPLIRGELKKRRSEE